VAEHRSCLSSPVHNAEYKRVLILDAVDDQVLTHSQRAISGAEIIRSRVSDPWELSKREEAICNRIDQAVGNLDLPALPRSV
jgi:hypothetical protein